MTPKLPTSKSRTPPSIAKTIHKLPPILPRCQICHEVLPDDFLANLPRPWAKTHNVRAQFDLCTDHKHFSAKAEAVSKKYPATNINWRQLRKRIGPHVPYLLGIVEGKTDSAYREDLAKEMRGRKGRVAGLAILSTNWQSHTPGYYGPKGAQIMLSAIMRALADDIRVVATNDALIAGGGVSAYAQSVLVPELGVRLVMEDMGVDEAQARAIVRESVELGELLNDDDGKEESEEEEEDGGV